LVIAKIYVEGGSGRGDARARQSFSAFLRTSSPKRNPSIVICGGRGAALRSFRKDESAECAVLIDAEGHVKSDIVNHLLEREDIDKEAARKIEAAGQGDRIFLMIETMENWLIADMESIALKYREVDARAAVLQLKKANDDAERISKADAEKVVAKCLPETWNKGKRMELVAVLRPDVVRRRSAEADRLFQALGHR
jgi:hypothetical protein